MVERFWYEGTIIKFNSMKGRHKILYTDGDCEWMNLEQHGERVQVKCQDNSWVMVGINAFYDAALYVLHYAFILIPYKNPEHHLLIDASNNTSIMLEGLRGGVGLGLSNA